METVEARRTEWKRDMLVDALREQIRDEPAAQTAAKGVQKC